MERAYFGRSGRPDANILDFLGETTFVGRNNGNKHIKKRKPNKRNFGYMGMNYNNIRNTCGLKKTNQPPPSGKETEISIIKFYLVKFGDKPEPKKRTESLIELDKTNENLVRGMELTKEELEEYKHVAQEIYESFFGEFDLNTCMEKVLSNDGDMEDAINELLLEFNNKVCKYLLLISRNKKPLHPVLKHICQKRRPECIPRELSVFMKPRPMLMSRAPMQRLIGILF